MKWVISESFYSINWEGTYRLSYQCARVILFIFYENVGPTQTDERLVQKLVHKISITVGESFSMAPKQRLINEIYTRFALKGLGTTGNTKGHCVVVDF